MKILFLISYKSFFLLATYKKTLKTELTSNYDPVGYIKELDLSDLKSPENVHSTEKSERTKYTEQYSIIEEINGKKIKKINEKVPLEKNFFRMKTEATNILLRNINDEKKLDNQNKSYFNTNPHLYLNYFGEMRQKLNFSDSEKFEDNLIMNNKENILKHKVLDRFYQMKNLNNLKIPNNLIIKKNSVISNKIQEDKNEKIKSEITRFPVIKALKGNYEEFLNLGQKNKNIKRKPKIKII